MSASDPDALKSDGVFELLSNHRRRMVLYYLRRDGGTVEVTDLAEQIAAMENDVPAEELTSQQRKRVYVSLYQTHLPKMAEMNAIEYDKDAGTVALAARADDIDSYLTKEDTSEYPWVAHYAVLTIVGGAILTLSLLDAPLFGAVPTLWLSIGLLIAFVVSGAVHYWRSQVRNEELPLELGLYDE